MKTQHLSKILWVVVLAIAIAMSGAGPAQAAVPAATACTPGNKVDKTAFFTAVAQKLINPSIPSTALARAVQAFILWEPYENTAACWNPLATTLGRSGSTKFNSSNVQNYPDFNSGVQATADTLNYTFNGQGAYYAPIRKLMASVPGQGYFDEAAIKASLKGWVGSDAYSSAVTAKWKTLYAVVPCCTPIIVFKNGVSRLWQDGSYNRANLTITADNLAGQTIYVHFWRNGRDFGVVSQKATSNSITFYDLDGAGPMNGKTTYFSQAAMNQNPNSSWQTPGCAGPSGGQGLCDSIYRP